MSSLTVFDFNSQQVRVVSINNEPWFVAKDVLTAVSSTTTVTAVEKLVIEELGDEFVSNKLIEDSFNREQNMLVLSEPALTLFVSRSRTELGKKMNRWVHVEVLPQIRKTGSYAIQDTTVTFKPNVPLSEIEEYLNLCEGTFGKAYRQRLLPICVKKFHPYLPVIDAEPAEKASLPTKALLNPTQIASVLGFYYKTGSPNPQKVNKLLEELGYQVNIAGRWSATEKAEGLCDRKPVETNSRTQKDQLLWTDDIIDVLKSATEE